MVGGGGGGREGGIAGSFYRGQANKGGTCFALRSTDWEVGKLCARESCCLPPCPHSRPSPKQKQKHFPQQHFSNHRRRGGLMCTDMHSCRKKKHPPATSPPCKPTSWANRVPRPAPAPSKPWRGSLPALGKTDRTAAARTPPPRGKAPGTRYSAHDKKKTHG